MPNSPKEKESKKEEGEESQILQGRLPNGELIQLKEATDSIEADGLSALGTPEQICNLLLTLQNDEESRRTLSQEIADAVIAGTASINDAALKILKEKYDKAKFHFGELSKKDEKDFQFSDEIKNLQHEELNPLVKRKKNLDGAKSQFYKANEELSNFCQNPDIFQSYIKDLRNGLKIGIKSAILYAKANDITLYIWCRDRNGRSKRLAFFEPAISTNKIHLFYIKDSGSFKLLNKVEPKLRKLKKIVEQEDDQDQIVFLPFSGLSINNDDNYANSNRVNNNANSESSQLDKAYSWFSHFWNNHNIPTKILLSDTKSEIDRVNWITSFTDGAGGVLRNFGPTALLTLLAHDFIIYWNQSKNCDQPLNCHYGATLGNILLGTSPSELSWASQFGGYLETELNFWLLPMLLPITMFGGGILNRLWHYYRHEPLNKDKHKEKDFDIEARNTLLRNYTSNILNDTRYWVLPFSSHIVLLSRLEFLLRWDSHLQDADRKIIFDDIKFIARNYHSLARLYAQSSLSRLADSFHGQDDENKPLKILHEQANQGNYYAKYLLWTLGKTSPTKSKIEFSKNVGLHLIFWVTSIYFSLRLPASLVFKFFNLVEYLKQKAACEATSDYEWCLVPEIADYQCLIAKCNSPDIYYPYRSNAQDCLNAFLSKPHSADEINSFVKGLPATFDSISFRNQNWYTWRPEDLKSVLDTFAKRFPVLKIFDLSIDQYKEIIIDDGIIDVLTNFFQQVNVLQLDIHNVGMGADLINRILLAVNAKIIEWLDITKTDADDSVAGTLKKVLGYKSLRVLKAVSNYFTDNGIGYIAQGSENSTLTDLDVSFNPFGALGWKYISNSLPKSKLERLSANDVESSQVDFKEFGKAVAQTPTLEQISLQRTNIGDQQIKEFSFETKSSNLKSLDVFKTAITGNGASNVIENFKNSTLEDVNLGGLPIQGKDLNNISKKLPDTNIKSLGIPNIEVTPSEFCQFTASLNQTSVSTLNVEKNALGDQGADCIKDAIEAPNSKLENVNYSANQASKNGGQKIMQAVAESDKVKIINLSKNPFAGLDRASVENMLQQNQQLEAVILDDTNIGPEVGNGIAKGLLKAKQLKQLSINDNPNLGNTANKNITQSLIKPIANMDKLGGKLSNDQLRDLHHAENQTQIESMNIKNTGLETDGGREFCQVWPVTHNALGQLQAKNNLVDPNKVNMENCQISSASKLSFDNLGRYFTTGYIFYNLVDYFFTDNRTWTLDDDDKKQVKQWQTELEYLKNQHKPQKTSAAAKNPHLNYLFEKIADLCYAVTAILARVEDTKGLSDTTLKDIRERLAAVEKNIHKISQYNKEMRSKHNKERRQRFEKRCKHSEEPGVVVTQRNLLTGKITQKFFVVTDAKTTEFLKAKKQTLAPETKTKSMRFTEMQQFWQLQRETEGLQINLKKLATEESNVVASTAMQSRK